MSFQPGSMSYTQGWGASPNLVSFPHLDVRDPTAQDTNYPIAKTWLNKTTGAYWILTALVASSGVVSATWSELQSSTSGAILPVPEGGTGVGTLTAHGVLIGEGTSPVHITAAGTTGQVLTATTSADPAFAAIGTGSGLTAHGVLLAENAGAFVATTAGTSGQFLVSNGASADPSFQTATPQLTVTPVAGATQAMTSNHSYVANDSAQTTFTLPATSSVGDIVQVVGSALNTGGWIIAQGAGQIIYGPAGHSTSGATGTATSAAAAAQSVTISCVVANTTWVITANSGTISLA